MVDEGEWWSGAKARVFISCGQDTPKEREIAHEVRRILEDELHYLAFLATEVHSPKGLTETIYPFLSTTDYILFIDFEREKLGPRRDEPEPKMTCYRGSLFSHQELGIASFLGADVLPFVRRGMLREGIAKFIAANGIEYDSPDDLLTLVREKVPLEGWKSDSRRELRIEVAPPPPPNGLPITLAFTQFMPRGTYQFHELFIKNLHRRVTATECSVHLLGGRGPSFPAGEVRDEVEMKFKYITNPTIVLPPHEPRQFDGMIVRVTQDGFSPRACPGFLNPLHIDSEEIVRRYLMLTPGDHEFDIRIYSREFGIQSATLDFHFDAAPGKCRLSVKGQKKAAAGAGETPLMVSGGPSASSATLTTVVQESGTFQVQRWNPDDHPS